MKKTYHTIRKQGKANEQELARFLSKNGQEADTNQCGNVRDVVYQETNQQHHHNAAGSCDRFSFRN